MWRRYHRSHVQIRWHLLVHKMWRHVIHVVHVIIHGIIVQEIRWDERRWRSVMMFVLFDSVNFHN
jgi:hypothetical protein